MQQTTSNYKRWSSAEDSLLLSEVSKNRKHNLAFIVVASQIGRTTSAVSQRYNKLRDSTSDTQLEQPTETVTAKTSKKWTEDEEQRLIRQVRAFPQNLNKCFLIVSEEIERTPAAVASHWYSVTSKRPEIICFFTASSKHIALNRKNGKGVSSTESIWRKLLRTVNRLIK